MKDMSPRVSQGHNGPGSDHPRKQIARTVDLDANALIHGLAWMLAGKAIKKAKMPSPEETG